MLNLSPRRVLPALEQLDARVSPANLAFSASEGSWHSVDNWLPRRLPGRVDTAIIREYAHFEVGTTRLNILHVGSKRTSAQLDVDAGNLQTNALVVGSSTHGNGILQQKGGFLAATSTEVGRDLNARGRLIIKQGAFTTQSMVIGRSGFGSVTVAGGNFRSATLSIGLYSSAAGSFLNLSGGTAQVTGQVLLGYNNAKDNSLTVRNANFSWGSKLIVSNGSTFYVEGSQQKTFWLSNNRHSVALELRAGSTLKVSFDNDGFSPINLQSGRMVVASTAKLVVDLSSYTLPEDQTALVNLVQYGSVIGKVQPNHIQFITPSGIDAEFRQTTTAWQAVISHNQDAPATSVQLQSAFTVSPAKNQEYIYVPSLMYDETEGLYKVWFCYHDHRVQGGDNIGYREHPQLEGLAKVATEVALPPSLLPTQFDQIHVCDPTVYRDPDTDTFFMLYGANTDGTQLASRTRIGLAVSENGGRTFRQRQEAPLLVPDSSFQPDGYGVGQPSVTRANDGYYYMVYTDVPGGGLTHRLFVVRSTSPWFTEREAVTSISAELGLGVSVDLLYDHEQNAFAVVSNQTPISTSIGFNKVRIAWFDQEWQHLRSDDWEIDGLHFSIGEGPALLASSTRQWRNSSMQTVMAGSISPASRSINEWAYWVRGDLAAMTVRLV